MKNNILLFVFVCLTDLILSSNLFALGDNFLLIRTLEVSNLHHNILAVSPPLVTTPIYLCQGSSATALTATASSGNTLIWYGTDQSGGIGSAIAPIPSTAVVGTTSYYVSETDGVTESTRSRIMVNIVANNGSSILNLKCDPSQINVADKYSSVFFDWSNIPSLPNQYTYSYSVNSASPITGTTIDSHLQVFGLTQGQSVTITLNHSTYPCDRSLMTCSVPCLTLSTPTFNQIAPICQGTTPAPPLPLISNEGIIGTWDKTVDNMNSDTYTFTPDSGQCATNQKMTIEVNPDSPGFSDFSICSGSSAPTLSTISPTGVTGTWDKTVDNMNSDTYTFTPDSGQCASPQTINVTVVPSGMLTDFQWTVSEAFAENQIVTITATLPDNYLYQMDFGPFQASPIFEKVAYGLHSVTVKDPLGCSSPITKSGILVVDFPRFFTPNDDGYNDSWNIETLKGDSTAKIRIFDRYGKLLAEIRPSVGAGWNGYYNGHPMPATDYWFVIDYVEQNVAKTYRSHFSLKR